MSKFLTELDPELKPGSDKVWILRSPLIYRSDLMGCDIEVPTAFQNDGASVPRVPIVYMFWGGRCHREAVLHDFSYCEDSKPIFTFAQANAVFLEAMESRGKSVGVRYPMFWGVWVGGYFSYHKRKVLDEL